MTVSAGAAGPRPPGWASTPATPRPHRPRPPWPHRPAPDCAAADRRTEAANRSGFSMKRNVSTASPPETTTVASLPASPSGWPSNGAASTSTGQCHRYHEYDTRPIARIGGNCQHAPALPEQAPHSPRRSPAPHPTRATARQYPDRACSCPTGCRSAGSPPDLPTPRSRQAAAEAGATGWP